MIGIISAMDVEINKLILYMKDVKKEKIAHINFLHGKINDKNCVIAVCGPGKVNAAVCAQIMITKFSPSAIVNTGISGSLDKKFKIGDILLANCVIQHDVDTSALGDEKGFISGINLVQIPCSKKLNKLFLNIAQKTNIDIYTGTIATGDQFIANCDKKLFIKNTFNADACEMEAGSIGQVCYINNIEFAVLKIISDNANETSHLDYGKFKYIVAEKTTNLIKDFFKINL